MADGQTIDLFDDRGATASGVLHLHNDGLFVQVGPVAPPAAPLVQWTIASAVPKGQRFDWMVEKLSELGAAALVPLRTERSVVHPEGAEKIQRWIRLAAKAAQQCGRSTVMRIEPLTDLNTLLADRPPGQAAWYLSTDPAARPIADAARHLSASSLLMLIGPEGDWSPAEVQRFEQAGLTGVSLGSTILRVETAAVAAAVVASVLMPHLASP